MEDTARAALTKKSAGQGTKTLAQEETEESNTSRVSETQQESVEVDQSERGSRPKPKSRTKVPEEAVPKASPRPKRWSVTKDVERAPEPQKQRAALAAFGNTPGADEEEPQHSETAPPVPTAKWMKGGKQVSAVSTPTSKKPTRSAVRKGKQNTNHSDAEDMALYSSGPAEEMGQTDTGEEAENTASSAKQNRKKATSHISNQADVGNSFCTKARSTEGGPKAPVTDSPQKSDASDGSERGRASRSSGPKKKAKRQVSDESNAGTTSSSRARVTRSMTAGPAAIRADAERIESESAPTEKRNTRANGKSLACKRAGKGKDPVLDEGITGVVADREEPSLPEKEVEPVESVDPDFSAEAVEQVEPNGEDESVGRVIEDEVPEVSSAGQADDHAAENCKSVDESIHLPVPSQQMLSKPVKPLASRITKTCESDQRIWIILLTLAATDGSTPSRGRHPLDSRSDEAQAEPDEDNQEQSRFQQSSPIRLAADQESPRKPLSSKKPAFTAPMPKKGKDSITLGSSVKKGSAMKPVQPNSKPARGGKKGLAKDHTATKPTPIPEEVGESSENVSWVQLISSELTGVQAGIADGADPNNNRKGKAKSDDDEDYQPEHLKASAKKTEKFSAMKKASPEKKRSAKSKSILSAKKPSTPEVAEEVEPELAAEALPWDNASKIRSSESKKAARLPRKFASKQSATEQGKTRLKPLTPSDLITDTKEKESPAASVPHDVS